MVSAITLQRSRDHAWMVWIDGFPGRRQPPELFQFHLLVARRMCFATQHADALASLHITSRNFGQLTRRPRTCVEVADASHDWQSVERDAAAHLRIVAELLVRTISNLDLMWSRLERRFLNTPNFDEVVRAEADLQYGLRQWNPMHPGLQSGLFSHPRPYVRVRDSAEQLPQRHGDWLMGNDIPAFDEPLMDNVQDMTTQSAFSNWLQASETLPAYQRHLTTVKEWHKAKALYERSLRAMRNRSRDAFRLTEDARLIIHASRDLDRAGYEWETASTHLPEYRDYRSLEGDAPLIAFWPQP